MDGNGFQVFVQRPVESHFANFDFRNISAFHDKNGEGRNSETEMQHRRANRYLDNDENELHYQYIQYRENTRNLPIGAKRTARGHTLIRLLVVFSRYTPTKTRFGYCE